MHPTQVLSDEHRVIEVVLGCVERLAHDAAHSGKLDTRQASDAVAFLAAFADACHHAKEEDILFPILETRGFSRTEGPTAVMRSEHTTGRHLVATLRAAVEAAARGEATASPTFVRAARDYVGLLRDHIAKEDHCLFPMAASALTPDESAAVLERFRQTEASRTGKDSHDHWVGVARTLAANLGVAFHAPVASGGGCCGHGHHHS